MAKTEIQDLIKEYETKLANICGSDPATEGLRGSIENDIYRLKTKLAEEG